MHWQHSAISCSPGRWFLFTILLQSQMCWGCVLSSACNYKQSCNGCSLTLNQLKTLTIVPLGPLSASVSRVSNVPTCFPPNVVGLQSAPSKAVHAALKQPQNYFNMWQILHRAAPPKVNWRVVSCHRLYSNTQITSVNAMALLDPLLLFVHLPRKGRCQSHHVIFNLKELSIQAPELIRSGRGLGGHLVQPSASAQDLPCRMQLQHPGTDGRSASV